MKRDNIKTPPVGECKVCGINCYADCGNKPEIWPCGIHRGGKEDCPYETLEQYVAHMQKHKSVRSGSGSGLALL